MSNNKGYLIASSSKESDEIYTPRYAIEPLIKYLEDYKNGTFKKNLTIWCPFDKEDSYYVKVFKENGYNVIYSHVDEGKSFFRYEPEEEYDIIISNPPFSKKDKVLDRLEKLNKPFAILFPLSALQGIKRFKNFKKMNSTPEMDIQILVFDKRINFFKDKETELIMKGTPFASIYLCWEFFIGYKYGGKDIIFDELDI